MYTKEQIITAFKKSPKKIREILLSPEFHNRFMSILSSYNLADTTCGQIENLITNKIIGLESEAEDKIKKLDIIPENISQEILKKINSEIISKLDDIHLESLNNVKIELEKTGQEFDVNEYLVSIDESRNLNYVVPEKNLKEKLDEISLKYDLDKDKKNILTNIFSSLSINSNEKDISEKLVKTLGVSSMMADLITDDLRKRIIESSIGKTQTPKPIEKKNPAIPEIRPVNTPMVEEDVPTISVPKYASTFKPQPSISNLSFSKPISQETTTPSKPLDTRPPSATETPTPSRINFGKTTVVENSQSSITGEAVQKPVFVPKFTGTPLNDVLENAESKEVGTANIINSKLSGITTNTVNKVEDKPATPIVKSYSVDPYREPLA